MKNKTSQTVILFFITAYFFTASAQQPASSNYRWHASIGLGFGAVKGDVAPVFPGSTWSFAVRRDLQKWLSVQVQYSGGILGGMNSEASFNYAKNPAWATTYNAPIIVQASTIPPPGSSVFQTITTVTRQPVTSTNLDPVYYNYRTTLHQLSLQARAKCDVSSVFNLYALAGTGLLKYKTMVDAEDANGRPYTALFRAVNDNYNSNTGAIVRADVLRDLRAGMDLSYETPAENSGKRINTFPWQLGAGLAVKISSRMELGFEYIYTLTRESLLDGQRWDEQPLGDARLSRYFDRIQQFGMTLSFGL